MPIRFDIEQVRQRFGCDVYFETGMWDPRTNVSSKQALKCGFEKVFCIEIRKDWIDLAQKVFEEEIKLNRYTLIHDDSVNMNIHLNLFENTFMKKTMFFLDAHVDNVNIKNFSQRCPLMAELNAIQNLSRKDHVIMIDDVRLLKQRNPWGDTSLGNKNWIDEIKQNILNINPNYKFMYLDGHIKNDVLCAYT